MKPIEFIEDYLNQVAPLTLKGEALRNYRYFDGHIDSFGMIQFMMALEERFGITFGPEDTEKEAFKTVGGLAAIIEEKLRAL